MACRLINYVNVGESISNRNLRGINPATKMNFTGGQGWYDLLGKEVITGPIASGCPNLWFHNPGGVGGHTAPPYAGSPDKETNHVLRYNKNLPAGSNAIRGAMHFDQFQEALVDDPALFGLNTTGIMKDFIPALSGWVGSGNGQRKLYLYIGRPAGDRKAADVLFPGYGEPSSYYNTDYVYGTLKYVIGAFAEGLCLDATALDESPNNGSTHVDQINIPSGDASYGIIPLVYNSGIHSPPTGFTGSDFPNPRRIKVYGEAVPATGGFTNWWRNYSCCSNYWNLDVANSGVTKFHDDQFAYPPIYLCLTPEVDSNTGDPDQDAYNDAAVVYVKASGYLAAGKQVVCKITALASQGFDIGALIDLATDPDVDSTGLYRADSFGLTLSDSSRLDQINVTRIVVADSLSLTVAEYPYVYDSTPIIFDVNGATLSGRIEENGLFSTVGVSVSLLGASSVSSLRGRV